MTKREFLKNLGILGAASPFMSALFSSCKDNELFYQDFDPQFNGKVLVIGAGAAGITAGHILHQNGIDFQILEASSIHGGRVKKTANFADFPIDLGGEWIHADPSILAKLNNDRSSAEQIDIINYNPQTISIWRDGRLRRRNIASNFYSEHKFKDSTWFDFFDQLMVPNFRDKINYNSPVTAINLSDNGVIVTTSGGAIYEADKVLVTVPIAILQNNTITFTPELPANKLAAINEEQMPSGLKVFVEFSERFYPDLVFFGNLFEASSAGDHLYYDAAFGKDSDRHVFALFTVGEKAETYTSLGSDAAIFEKVMGELDAMFDGQASQHYMKHIVQDWSREVFIQGSYSQGYSSPEVLAEPVGDRIYFAGEAMAPNENTSTVHGAAESSYAALKLLLTT